MRIGSTILLLFIFLSSFSQDHPSLILTKGGVKSLKESLGKTPLLDSSFETIKKEVDTELAKGIDVPVSNMEISSLA